MEVHEEGIRGTRVSRSAARSVLLRAVLAAALLWVAPPVRAFDTNAFLNGWFAAQSQLHTLTADFIQTRTLKTLTVPLTAHGRLYFSTPGSFRWELGQPARTIALGQKDEMYVIYPLLKRAEHYSLGEKAPKDWRDAMALLQAGFPHSRAEFEGQFQILAMTETNGVCQMSLQPRSSFARQMMPELRLAVATNDYSLRTTELVIVDGSNLRNDFSNIVMNPQLDGDVFHWNPPADFKVTEPFAK